MSSPNKFRYVSLFAGCGGSSLGYHMAGGQCLLAVEWDDHAAASYKLNFPETDVFHGDVCSLSVEEIMQRTGLKEGELEILDGSPPCQGFSTAAGASLKTTETSSSGSMSAFSEA